MARRDDDEGFNFDDVEEESAPPATVEVTAVSLKRNQLSEENVLFLFCFLIMLRIQLKRAES